MAASQPGKPPVTLAPFSLDASGKDSCREHRRLTLDLHELALNPFCPKDLSSMHLIILEDDPHLGEAMALGLRQQGHVVDWFQDGQPASHALKSAAYDALILDLGLPRTDA